MLIRDKTENKKSKICEHNKEQYTMLFKRLYKHNEACLIIDKFNLKANYPLGNLELITMVLT